MWLESPNACWPQRAPAWHVDVACLHRVDAAITKDANAWRRGRVLSQDSKDPIAAHLALSFAALDRAVHDPQLRASAREIAATIIAALRSGNKLLIIGNGGSAADAQHIAAEIVGRYKQDRPANAAMALTTEVPDGRRNSLARSRCGRKRRTDSMLRCQEAASAFPCMRSLSRSSE